MKTEIYKALELAHEAHAGQVDKSGVGYVLHPIRVSYYAKSDEERIVALLHDVLEDSAFTEEDIKTRVTDNPHILEALRLLTRDRSEPYYSYVGRIATSGNPLAIAVKTYDLLDNSDPNRGPVYHEAKYREALRILRGQE